MEGEPGSLFFYNPATPFTTLRTILGPCSGGLLCALGPGSFATWFNNNPALRAMAQSRYSGAGAVLFKKGVRKVEANSNRAPNKDICHCDWNLHMHTRVNTGRVQLFFAKLSWPWPPPHLRALLSNAKTRVY